MRTSPFRNTNDMDRRALVAYVQDLEHRLMTFEGSDETIANLKSRFGVRPAGARILAQLATGRAVSHDRLTAAAVLNPETGEETLKVQVCHVRKILAGTGIVITTIWGEGYRITEGAEIVQAAMRGDS